MTFKIQNSVEAFLAIDNKEYPLSNHPNVNITIVTNTKTLLPTVKMNIPDYNNKMGKEVPVNDGSFISVAIGDGSSSLHPPVNFRSFGTPQRRPSGSLANYSILGLLDAIPYISSHVGRAITGHSVDVMQEIAQIHNFNYNSSVNTNDKMTWRPGRQPWAMFMRNVTKHAFIDDQSAFHSTVDEQRNLSFVNIPQLFANGQVNAVIYYGNSNNADSNLAPKSFQALQYKAVNRSGMLNNNKGYGLRISQTSIMTGSVNKYTNVAAQKVNNVLDISKNIFQAISQNTRFEIAPVDTGNTHQMYISARHQNSRLLSTYSQNLYVLLYSASGLKPYDMVYFNANNANGPDYSSQGIYCVTAIARVVQGGIYREKLELTSNGPQSGNPDLL